MITYVVLFPGEIATGATFTAEQPTLELCGDALAAYHGMEDRDALAAWAGGSITLGFAPLH
jgi:hypothetical protein